MYIQINTTNKDVIIKHLAEALEDKDTSIAYLKKLENGDYHVEITCSVEHEMALIPKN